MSELFLAFDRDPVTVARSLLGQRLVREERGRRLAGLIVEVEAYLGAEDRAAHTYRGRRTRRNASMYLPGGHAYVYFTYGLHHCLNVVCGKRDDGVAVLIRALEPTEGLDVMYARRPAARASTDLCSGPAKLTQALAVDRALDGIDLRRRRRLWVERVRKRAVSRAGLEVTARIGVGYAREWKDQPLRFAVRGNPHVSRRGGPPASRSSRARRSDPARHSARP